jgi:hypothetical protein
MVDERAQRFIDRRQPQNIANCVWAYGRAKLGIKLLDLFCLLEERTEWLVDNGNPQEVANYAWAYGKLGIKSSNQFHLIDKRAQCLFDHGQPQNIANYYMSVQNGWLTDNGNPPEVANCVGACGKPGI